MKTKSQDLLLSSKRKIRFQDCDPFNHLNNSKYLDYFINTREDQLLEYYNIDIYEIIRNKQIAWVIGDHKTAYFKPAYAKEGVVIETQLIDFTTKSIRIKMKVYDSSKQKLKSILWTNLVLMDLKSKRSIDHDEQFLELFKKVKVDLEISDFENRIKKLRRAS